MKKLFFTFLLLIFFTSCFEKSKTENELESANSFPAVTLKGELVEFTNVKSGMIKISDSGLKKLYQLDESGEVKYFTSDLISYFETSSNTYLEKGRGYAVSFTVPQISKGDYIIISTEIILPNKVKMGNSESNILPGSFRYTDKHSGRTEYIWILFDEINLKYFTEGNWELLLYNQDTILKKIKFTVNNQR